MMRTEKDQIEATVVTDRHKIEGRLHLYQNSRLSDLLNMDMNKRDFIPVTDAVIYDLGSGELVQELPFLALNRRFIVMVYATPGDRTEIVPILKRANAHFLGKKYDDSIIEARKALKLDPKEPEAMYLLGLAYSKKGMIDEGRATFEKIVSEFSQNSTWVRKAHDMLEQLK
jgi:tetratricopeptide (TPR) repeat protein